MANPSMNRQDSSFAQAPSLYGAPSQDGNDDVLYHNPAINLDWSPEEKSILKQGLLKYADDPPLIRYGKISNELRDKTIRDIAYRYNWMKKNEISNRRKLEHGLTRESEDGKEGAFDPRASLVSRLNYDDDGCRVIGGVIGMRFEQNERAFNRIYTNFSSSQVMDNLELLCQARDNILRIMYDPRFMPEGTDQLPPLPVKINEQMSNGILPRPNLPVLP